MKSSIGGARKHRRLLVVGAMAMAMYEFFSVLERHTTAWAHRGSQSR